MQHRSVRATAAAVSVGVAAVSFLVLGAGAADAAGSGRHSLGSAPSWATSSHRTGTLSSQQTVSFRVVMGNSHTSSIDAFIKDVTDPSSKDYGKYLTPEQYDARFAPSDADIAQVKSFLAGQGMKVTDVADGNKWIDVTGTAAQIDKAFDTTMNTYSHGGKHVYAPSTAISVPTSVAGVISGVTGLVEGSTTKQPGVETAADAAGTSTSATSTSTSTSATGTDAAKPPTAECSDYWGEHQQTLPEAYGTTEFNTYLCGLTPAQLRSLYGTTSAVAKGTTGKGVTVAILDAYASPTMESDADQYAEAVGDKPFAAGQYSEKVFQPFDMQDECGGEANWNGEETLDVEAVHGMAPDANVLYVGASDCDTGLDDAMNWVVETHAASIVSNSYGWTGEPTDADGQAEVQVEHALAEQAAAEGIGLYFSSGDDGDNVIDGLDPQPDYESSDPYVTAVGGTSEIIGKDGKLVARTGWETLFDLVDYSGSTPVYEDPLPGAYFYAGAGGGTSQLFTEPWYQKSDVPSSLSQARGKTAMRVVPDIAADADPYTGMYIGETTDDGFTISSIGGTSLATPLIAGIQALAQQGRKTAIGFANPLLYSLPSTAITDVTPHSGLHFASLAGSYLGTFDAGDTQSTARGYDDETGLGVPNSSFITAEDRVGR
ncbi:S53 family peptidase [Gryllotalpicola ginsengisoli]|uniref:S53 family peptidase n=1 Tax=Gryllotalpicola ginsengisoli TaxID=444608 RepID=UPI0003B59EC6|nr:S53 family peptidase [Gryllotalpicola ginsengisoli]